MVKYVFGNDLVLNDIRVEVFFKFLFCVVDGVVVVVFFGSVGNFYVCLEGLMIGFDF